MNGENGQLVFRNRLHRAELALGKDSRTAVDSFAIGPFFAARVMQHWARRTVCALEPGTTAGFIQRPAKWTKHT